MVASCRASPCPAIRALPSSRFRPDGDAGLESARGRRQAAGHGLAQGAAMGARHGPARRRKHHRQGHPDLCARRTSALYTPYNYELGVDLREQMTLCDAGDVFTIPANLEKSFDQITRGVAHVFSSGALPIMLGGDHSIGFPCVRGIAQCTDKKIGIIHFDRHIDIQEKDLDERMHTTPWFWATNLPNVPAVNLVQLGIGGWQVPREGVQVARQRNTNVLTIADIEKFGIEKSAEIALDLAWKDADAVYISFDVDSIDCGFVPGTGWPEPGGFLPREALKLLGLVCAQGICGFEVVEVSPPYDTSDITALMGVRVVVEALGALTAHGKLGSHRSIINKPVTY